MREEYTVKDRLENMKYSLFSWITVIAHIIIAFDGWYEKHKNDKVKW